MYRYTYTYYVSTYVIKEFDLPTANQHYKYFYILLVAKKFRCHCSTYLFIKSIYRSRYLYLL